MCVDHDGKAHTRSFTRFLALSAAVALPPVEAPVMVSVAPKQPACVTAADRFQWVPFGAGKSAAPAPAPAVVAASPKKHSRAAEAAPAETPSKKKHKKDKS